MSSSPGGGESSCAAGWATRRFDTWTWDAEGTMATFSSDADMRFQNSTLSCAVEKDCGGTFGRRPG